MRALPLVAALVLSAAARPAHGHFQLLIPSIVNVNDDTGRTIVVDIRFTHPMSGGPLMDMAPPVRFGVVRPGMEVDLLGSLERVEMDGKGTFRASYTLEMPGDHVFFVEPAPYWEAAEGTYIVHFTKVVVDGFDGGGGWDRPVGFPVEIMPLVRPYGLWTGNTFRGNVLRDGVPVSNAHVEVEYLNEREPKVKIPSGAFETQVVRTNADGEFLYTMPRAGWWGFAALVDGPVGVKAPDGSAADVEWGGVMWVPARDME